MLIREGKIINWENIESYSRIPSKFRFVDYAEISKSENKVMARKNVSSQDWYFPIHFPNNPVMPGVLIMEVIKQAGELLVASLTGTNGELFFQECKNMRLYNSVRPGDVLNTNVVMEERENGMYSFNGNVVISRDRDEKNINVCNMEFVMSTVGNKMPQSEFDYRNDILLSNGTNVKFNYTNFSSFLADPPEYRFIDESEVLDNVAHGKKNCSCQDWFFSFLPTIIMPIGFIMEAIMQTGVLIVTSKGSIEDPLMMFNGCSELEIYDSVSPGDVLETWVKLLSYRNGIANYQGFAYKNEKIICKMNFTLINPVELKKLSDQMARRR